MLGRAGWAASGLEDFMKRLGLSLALLTAFGLSVPAHAASLTRTFVSSAGNDTNLCTITQPCATFAAAYGAVAANGIVAALDPGKYGPLTISGPVTIDGNGWAAITAPTNTDGGIIVASDTSDNVVLRGLILDGAGTGFVGINFESGASLTVDGCVVRNMAQDGLRVFTPSGAAQTLTVSKSHFIGNGEAGIVIDPFGNSTITASIDWTEFNGNTFGIFAQGNGGPGTLTVAVTDSAVANSGSYGIGVQSPPGGASANATVTRSQIAGSGTSGLLADGMNATLWLAQSTVAGNVAGYTASDSGVIKTFGDNSIVDTNNDGSLTPVNKQ
jgi:Right handed beta helix region